MTRCPECNSKISDSATICPYCGFSAPDRPEPIGNVSLAKKHVSITIPDAIVFEDGMNLVPKSTNDAFVAFFMKEENVSRFFPSLYQTIKSIMSRGETKWTADFTEEAEELMRRGELILMKDSKGKILPQLRAADNKQIYEMVRLREEHFPDEMMPSIASLQLQITMAQVLSEIKNVASSIEALRIEIQADRIAQAESVWMRLQQAAKISDSRLRERQIADIASAATTARCLLQHNFSIRHRRIKEGGAKEKAGNADAALNTLAAIISTSRSEYAAYSLLEEESAARESLRQLSDFMKKERLDDRNALLEINSQAKNKQPQIVDGFCGITNNLLGLLEKKGDSDSTLELQESDKNENGHMDNQSK